MGRVVQVEGVITNGGGYSNHSTEECTLIGLASPAPNGLPR